MKPTPLCEGFFWAATNQDLLCFGVNNRPCAIDQALPPNVPFSVWRPPHYTRFTPDHFHLRPTDERASFSLDEEHWVQGADYLLCDNHLERDSRIRYRNARGPNTTMLTVTTIFEHVRDIQVRAGVDLYLAPNAQAYPAGNVEIALQIQNSRGSWVDQGVKRSTFLSSSVHFSARRQRIEVSATLPALVPVVLRVRTGAATNQDPGSRIELLNSELRGEECVPSNVPGQCL